VDWLFETKRGAVVFWIVFVVAILGAVALIGVIDDHYGGKAAAVFAIGCIFLYIGVPFVFLSHSKKIGVVVICLAFAILIVQLGLVGGDTLHTVVNDL
jgi:hypothetical protein